MALIYVLVKLSALITTLFLAIMLAVTLRPSLNWMEAMPMPRWLGLMAIAASMILAVAFICMVVLAPLLEQITAMLNRFPEMQKSFVPHT